MSFLANYLEARRLRTNPAYATQMRDQQERDWQLEDQTKRQEFMGGLMGNTAQPQQTAPYQQSPAEMFPGEQPVQGLQDVTAPAQPGSGYLGGEFGDKEMAMRMMAAPTEQTRGIGGSILQDQVRPGAKMTFSQYQQLSAADQKKYDTFVSNSFAPVDTRTKAIKNDQYMRGLGTKEERDAFRKRERASQWLNTGVSHLDPDSGQEIDIDIIGREINEKVGGDAGDRLVSFDNDLTVADNMISSLTQTQKELSDLSGMTNYQTTGFMSWLKGVPTSDVKAWDNLKTTVLSRLGLEKLLQMKASSPTGASGFGALSAKELDLLVSHMGKLDQESDPIEIKRIIGSIMKQLDGAKGRMEKKRNMQLKFYRRNRHHLPESMRISETAIEGYLNPGGGDAYQKYNLKRPGQ